MEETNSFSTLIDNGNIDSICPHDIYSNQSKEDPPESNRSKSNSQNFSILHGSSSSHSSPHSSQFSELQQSLPTITPQAKAETKQTSAFVLNIKEEIPWIIFTDEDPLFTIDQFYHLLDTKNHPEHYPTLPSYDLKHWEKPFRQALLRHIHEELVNNKSVPDPSLRDFCFQAKLSKFKVRETLSVIQYFSAKSLFGQQLNIKNPKKIKSQDFEKILQKIGSFFDISHLKDKYQQKYMNLLSKLSTDTKNPKTSMNTNDPTFKHPSNFFYEISPEKLNQTPQKIDRSIQLQLLAIKLYFRILKMSFFNVTELKISQSDNQPSFVSKGPNRFNQSFEDFNHQLNQIESENTFILECQNQETNHNLTIAHFESSIEQFQKDINFIFVALCNLDEFRNSPIFSSIIQPQLSLFRSQVYQAITYFLSALVAEVQFIQQQKSGPQKSPESIQFLFNEEELLQFVNILSEMIAQSPAQNETLMQLSNQQIEFSPVISAIKQKFPELMLLMSDSNSTSSILCQIIGKYQTYLRPPTKSSFSKVKIQKNEQEKENLETKKVEQVDLSNKKFDWKKEIRNIFYHIGIWNFLMLNSHFARQKPFDLSSFCVQQGINVSTSDLTHKWDLFWKTYQEPLLLKKFAESICGLSLKKIGLASNEGSQNFGAIFRSCVDLDEIRICKLKYILHMVQYFLQIISELNSQTSVSLSQTFNVIRFLITNFISFVYIQSRKRVLKEIRQKLGEPYYDLLEREIQNEPRLLQNHQKFLDAIKISGGQVQKYVKAAKLPEIQSSNSRKLFKIFAESPEIKQLFEKLNCTSPIQDEVHLKKPQEAILMDYDFTIFKQCYTVAVQLLTEYLSKSTIVRMVEKKNHLEIDEVDQARPDKSQSDLYKRCLKFSNANKITLDDLLNTTQWDTNECYQIYFQKFVSNFFEMSKLTALILSIPFYSYENELSYIYMRKNLNCQKLSQDKNIFYNLDSFYIHQCSRLDTLYVKSLTKNFQLLPFILDYIMMLKPVFKFYQTSCLDEKLKMMTQNANSIGIESQMSKYPKNIHTETNSIFSRQELEDFFFTFNQETTPKDKCRMSNESIKRLNEFIEMCNTMEGRVSSVSAEIKQENNAELGLVKESVQVKEQELGNCKEQMSQVKKQNE